MKDLEKKTELLLSNGELRHQDIERYSKASQDAHAETMQRIASLEEKITNIERNYVTLNTVNSRIADALSVKTSVEPLTTMDVNYIIEEYLASHGHETLNTNSVNQLIEEYTRSHPVSLEQLHPEEYQELRAHISSQAVQEMHRLIYEDSLAKPDFALAAVGAKVIDYTGKWGLGNVLDKFLPFGETNTHPPSVVLQGFSEVGDCWAFYGEKAFLSIRLSTTILPESISLDHISASIAHVPNLTSAPREFRVFVSFHSPSLFMRVLIVSIGIYVCWICTNTFRRV